MICKRDAAQEIVVMRSGHCHVNMTDKPESAENPWHHAQRGNPAKTLPIFTFANKPNNIKHLPAQWVQAKPISRNQH